MNQTYESICKKLAERDYKLTNQRRIILEAFLGKGVGHLSAEDLYMMVKKAHPEIGLATVYRTLDLLAELDVLQKMNFGDGRARYELNQSELHHHHHLVCLNCGLVTEFNDDLLDTLEDVVSRKSGFKIIDHDLKFFGYCKKCQEV